MYAQLCRRLSEEAPNFEPPGVPCTFTLLLLSKCKVEFEHRSEIIRQYGYKNQTVEEEERRNLAKRKMLGNIKFIGELGKLEILSESILHLCIQALLVTKRGYDPSEDLECLCQIMRTCGRNLDSDKGKGLMEQYFERMSVLADNQELQPRIRFMLKDVIDLRSDGWAPRKAAVVDGPVPIHQIKPVEDDRSFRRDRNQDRGHDSDRSNMSELFRHPMKTRGGLEGMLMGLNLSSSTTNLIPTHFNSNGYHGGQREGGFRGHNNQRSGFNNYNNQRGQYKHNQNNSNNSQYNNQSKELAPRFKKNLIVAQNIGEVELRPSANSMLFNKQTVKTNNMMNSRTIDTSISSAPKQTSTPLLKEPLPIKQVSTEKPKQTKKDKGPNKEEVLKKFSVLVDELIKGDATIQQAVESYKEHKVPDKLAKDAILSGLKLLMVDDKIDDDRRKFVSLMAALRKEGLINNMMIQDSFKALCNMLEECENEKTKAAASISILFAAAVQNKILTVMDVALFTEHGAHHPLFLNILQEVRELIGEKELSQQLNDSKINLLGQLPENDRNKERLTSILEETRLTFLCPMLLLETDLAKQLQTDPNPQLFYKWIKENLESIDFTAPGFVTALMTVLLKYITQEATSAGAGDEKIMAEKEKMLLDRYQQILQAFLHEQPALQLVAVYALQVHFYALGFPRGQLLRWFNALYDLSIVEEEAFLTWKEDVTDVYPGKGQALFQVNQWLTWLQEAESEEEEGDE